MNFKDYSAHIAKKANVNEAAAQRMLQALFTDVKNKLDKSQDVILPTVGRLINQGLPNGGKRVLLSRPEPKTNPQRRNAPKAKAARPVKKAPVKPRTAAKNRPAAQKKK